MYSYRMSGYRDSNPPPEPATSAVPRELNIYAKLIKLTEKAVGLLIKAAEVVSTAHDAGSDWWGGGGGGRMRFLERVNTEAAEAALREENRL